MHGYIRYYNEVCLKLRLKNLSSVQDRAQYLISVQVLGQVKVRSFFLGVLPTIVEFYTKLVLFLFVFTSAIASIY